MFVVGSMPKSENEIGRVREREKYEKKLKNKQALPGHSRSICDREVNNRTTLPTTLLNRNEVFVAKMNIDIFSKEIIIIFLILHATDQMRSDWFQHRIKFKTMF